MAALMFGAQWLAPRLVRLGALIDDRVQLCAPCVTFWLTFLALSIAAAVLQDYTLNAALWCVIFAFINFFYIKSKIQVYE